MKKHLLKLSLLFLGSSVFAQTQKMGTPLSWKDKVGVTAPVYKMQTVDNSTEYTLEMERRSTSFEKNLRFGKELAVSINVMNEATVRTLPNGSVIRQLTIESKNAVSVNLIFDQFKLSQNAVLYLFNDDKTEFIGAHTSLNNNANNMMGTELIHDDKVIIELIEPATEAGTSVLNIGTVIHGFIDLESEIKALNSSGSCNYDVNCPIGAGWENQRNSVAMMVNGGGFCTGSLVNNTTGTIIPYFLSANHCGTSPGSWVFRFRWESPAGQADCATAAPSVNGPETMNVNGGVLRANYSPSDFTLTELNTAPNPAWGIYYNGWNRSNVPATSAVGIHHPAGDIKKISFENTPLISTTFGSSPANSHWGVTSWDNGVTEGGSSGSPLFDENHRTVGQLHGGASACGAPQLSDEYGKFFTSWTGGGTNSTRLSNWLDPSGTAGNTIDGVDPAGPGVPIDAGMNAVGGATGTLCVTSVTPTVTIVNSGSDILTSATVTYGYDGVYNQVFNWTGSLNQYQTAVITLPTTTLAGGAHTFQATVSNPNGSSDGNAANNVITSNFSVIANPINVDLSLTLDCYGSEITWKIVDSATSAIIFSQGGPYSDDSNGGEVISQQVCLSEGCYKFVIEDSYGDGLTSTGCPVAAGSYTLTDPNNVELAGLTTAQANFGDINTQDFCVQAASGAGVDELHNTWGMYPNPAKTSVIFALPATNDVKTIAIQNMFGQVVDVISTSESTSELNVSEFAKGVYTVTITTNTGVSTKSLVIE